MQQKDVDFAVYFKTTPDKDGFFGRYGVHIFRLSL